MSVDLRLPNITGNSDTEKINQLSRYIFQLTEQLNFSLNNIESRIEIPTNQSIQFKNGTAAEQSKGEDEKLMESYQKLKDLIVKSADFVQRTTEEVKQRLSGSYVAVSDFGSYLEETTVDISGTPVGITQLYSYSAGIKSSFADFSETNQTYVKTGLLYYSGSTPVYGVGVGVLESTTDVNGRTVLDRSGLSATFTADKISFWSADTELAYITPTMMYFPNGKLRAVNANITGTIETGNLTATGGEIGGWKIGTKALSTQSGLDGFFINSASSTENYWIRARYNGSNTFSVSKTGTLKATDVDLKGEITATSGAIGGCVIDNGTLKVPALNITGTIGASQINADGIEANNVKLSGNITATSGAIGGWKITDSYICSPSGEYGLFGQISHSGGVIKPPAYGYLFSVLTNNGIGYILQDANIPPETIDEDDLIPAYELARFTEN